MEKYHRNKKFINQPKFQGGIPALKAFIAKHLTYPEKALKAKIEGTVKLRYTINHKGLVTEAQTLSSLGHGCNEEAIRLVKLLKFEVPKNRGVKVQFHRTINIHFRLPKKKIIKKKVETPKKVIQYTVKPAKSPEKSYSYTIKF